MPFKPCIIIPIYNHKDTIVATVVSLRHYGLPVIIIDDGSNADTQLVLAQLAQQESLVQLHRHVDNQGRGAAVLTGFKLASQAGATHALQIDADGQHDITDVQKFLDLAKRNPCALIYGQPIFDDSIPKFRLIARYITHFWVCIEILSLKIVDTICGFRLYPLASVHQLITKVQIRQRMDFDTDIMVRLIWENVPIMPVPTKVIYPENGSSHFDYVADNIRISKMHTRLFLGMLKRLPWLIWRPRSQHTHWSKIPELGASCGINAMLWVYRYLGRWVFKLLLAPVIGYFFISAGMARRESQKFLQKVYACGSTHPRMATPPTLCSSFYHFLEFGRAALDRIASWLGDIKRSDVDFDNVQEFIDLMRSGSGGLIIGSHLGNIELSRALATDIDMSKLNILVFTENAVKFNTMLAKVNCHVNDQLIQVNQMGPDTAIMLKEKIDNGELIIILGDRTAINSTEKLNYVNFLGEEAAFGQGPFILASLLECPVYLLFCLRQGQRYRVHFEHFSDRIKLNRKTRQQDLQQIIQKFAVRLEYYCLQEPFQWFNFLDFWHKNDTHS